MRNLLLIAFVFLLPASVSAQVIGRTQTEQYKAAFETGVDPAIFRDYRGKTIPIQVLQLGINEEVYAMYPELKDNRVGLGVTNIVIEFMEETNRFTFTEEKTEIKNRMVKQFQASQSGITANELDGRGKIMLARYFAYIEVYDFSVSEDETINMKDGVKNTVVTRLGLQVRFVDAETGQFFTGSGLGEATTVRELTLMNDDNFGEVKFNQSTIGIATKKALEIATSKIVTRMINRGIYEK
jgi:hypothetical protein